MPPDFDILAWYRMQVLLLSGFLPVYLLARWMKQRFPQVSLLNMFGEHFPKALAISNLFFCIGQAYGAFMKPDYLENIAAEISGNFFFAIMTLFNIALLALLFIKPGRTFARLTNTSAVILTIVFLLERSMAADVGSLSGFFPVWLKSMAWFLLLGSLVALSEWTRYRYQKK